MRLITELTGRYHLEELIAAGGMGEVWRAVDQILARPVAVKLLRPEYTHDEVTLARFRAEAQHAGLLNHPGIAQVYDYRDASPESPAYLVMELVAGPSLAAVLAAGRLETCPHRGCDGPGGRGPGRRACRWGAAPRHQAGQPADRGTTARSR